MWSEWPVFDTGRKVMGQAKLRGTFEQRKAEGVKKSRAREKKRIERAPVSGTRGTTTALFMAGVAAMLRPWR